MLNYTTNWKTGRLRHDVDFGSSKYRRTGQRIFGCQAGLVRAAKSLGRFLNTKHSIPSEDKGTGLDVLFEMPSTRRNRGKDRKFGLFEKSEPTSVICSQRTVTGHGAEKRL